MPKAPVSNWIWIVTRSSKIANNKLIIRIFSEDRQNFKSFKFDKVCDESYDQDMFYNHIAISNYVDRVLDV
jgi:hypothetical protein